jgi:hypothetical protein
MMMIFSMIINFTLRLSTLAATSFDFFSGSAAGGILILTVIIVLYLRWKRRMRLLAYNKRNVRDNLSWIFVTYSSSVSISLADGQFFFYFKRGYEKRLGITFLSFLITYSSVLIPLADGQTLFFYFRACYE